MGEIIKSKVKKNKVRFHIVVDEPEALALSNRIKNIHLFSSKLTQIKSKIIEKGRNGATKHFLLPSKLKGPKQNKFKLSSCEIIDTLSKSYFIYVCKK